MRPVNKICGRMPLGSALYWPLKTEKHVIISLSQVMQRLCWKPPSSSRTVSRFHQLVAPRHVQVLVPSLRRLSFYLPLDIKCCLVVQNPPCVFKTCFFFFLRLPPLARFQPEWVRKLTTSGKWQFSCTIFSYVSCVINLSVSGLSVFVGVWDQTTSGWSCRGMW